MDTNIYCDYAQGCPETVEILAAHGETLFMPAIVVGELRYGFMKGNRFERNERKLRQIIRQLEIEVIDVNEEVASKYAFIYLALVRKGRKIPINDVWIAASCMSVAGTLLTRDRHFGQVEQIQSIILEGGISNNLG